jgi:predicted RNA-binding Zn ribbon-like protein
MEKQEVERDGFYFLGNQLALDFVNTRPLVGGELIELIPDLAALLRWFAAAELVTPAKAAALTREWADSREGRKTVAELIELRQMLRQDILNWIDSGAVRPATISRLNKLMAEFPLASKIVASAAVLKMESDLKLTRPADLFGPIAHSAAELFTQIDRSRVRKCAHCIGIFHDTSKKGTRRWCSMQLCGNRAKVAAYAARQRQ